MAAERKLTPLQALEEEMVQAVVNETGWKADLARMVVTPIVRHLCSEYGGERIYIPSARSELPVEEVRRFFAETNNVAETCSRFFISRRTLYRVLSGAD